jgi:hypothetical protein
MPKRATVPAMTVVAAVAVALTYVNLKPLQDFYVERRQDQNRVLALIPPRGQLPGPVVALVQMPYGSRYVGCPTPTWTTIPGCGMRCCSLPATPPATTACPTGRLGAASTSCVQHRPRAPTCSGSTGQGLSRRCRSSVAPGYG